MNARVHNRLPGLHRQAVYALTAFLVLTGALWLGTSYLGAAPGEPVPAPHPWNGSLVMMHGIAAYAALIAYALVGHAHLRIGWRRPVLRAAGIALLAAIVILAATGLALYYAASDATREWARWIHVAAGVAMPVALAVHIRNGRRIARDGSVYRSATAEGRHVSAASRHR